jgi:predicted nicotinamide N-methyase
MPTPSEVPCHQIELRLGAGAHRVVLVAPTDPETLPDPFGRPPGEKRMPFWARVWPGGVALAAFLLDGPAAPAAAWRGQPVVELGCGLGAAGLAAALAGAEVTLTDEREEALAFALAGAHLTGVPVAVARRAFSERRPDPRFAAVLAAEVLYDRLQVAPFVATVDECLCPGGVAYLADVPRLDRKLLLAAAADRGLTVDLVAQRPYSVPPADGAEPRIVHILRLARSTPVLAAKPV